jgi:hypothetical protein
MMARRRNRKPPQRFDPTDGGRNDERQESSLEQERQRNEPRLARRSPNRFEPGGDPRRQYVDEMLRDSPLTQFWGGRRPWHDHEDESGQRDDDGKEADGESFRTSDNDQVPQDSSDVEEEEEEEAFDPPLEADEQRTKISQENVKGSTNLLYHTNIKSLIPMALAVIASLVAAVALHQNATLVETLMSLPRSAASTQSVELPSIPACFMTFPQESDEHVHVKETMTAPYHHDRCDESKDLLPCPQGGTCSKGLLHSCKGPHYVVSDTQTQCLLSSTANETIECILQVLSKMTADYYCSLTVTSRNADTIYKSPPQFHGSKIIPNSTTHDPSLLQLFDNIIMYNNQTLEIGLQETIAWSVVPWTCRLSVSLARIMQSADNLVLYPFRVYTWVWWHIKQNPLQAVGGFVAIVAAVLITFVSKMLLARK